jgi:hypothetical protein
MPPLAAGWLSGLAAAGGEAAGAIASVAGLVELAVGWTISDIFTLCQLEPSANLTSSVRILTIAVRGSILSSRHF